MRVLTKLDNKWYLSHLSEHPDLGAQILITVGLYMPRTESLEWFLERDYRYAYVRDSLFQEMTFYPDLRYHDYALEPLHWYAVSRVPALCCAVRIEDICSSEDELENAKRRDAVIGAGWNWPWRGEIAMRYFHVDDLEKHEGAPLRRSG